MDFNMVVQTTKMLQQFRGQSAMTESDEEGAQADFRSLLDGTIDRLRRADGTDIPLLDILVKHIVTLSPVNNAVDQAAKAIEALAVKREKDR